MRLLSVLVVALGAAAACSAPGPAPLEGPSARVLVTPREDALGPRVLCVTAHPDDETAFAATLYALTHLADATCDLLLITNGEGGFKYASLAEPIYGAELTREAVGRERLPAIRRAELLGAARLLGVHEVTFLGERDHRYTTDEGEVLGPRAEVWNLLGVRAALRRILEAGDYEYVLTLAPAAGTHAHHKAATLLALGAVAALPVELRPAVLAASVLEEGEAPEFPAEGLAGWPITRLRAGVEPFEFSRTRSFGYQGRLDWRVVVNWVIAEHKSQGTMQLYMNRGAREVFGLFDVSPPDSAGRCEALFAGLAAPPFPAREYGPSAGTNTGAAPRP